MIRILLIFVLFVNYTLAGTCTSLSRQDYTANSILLSSRLNADFNQIITNINEYDLGCGADNSLNDDALKAEDFSVMLSSISRGCELSYTGTSTLEIAPCRASVYQTFVTTTATTAVDWGDIDSGSAASGMYYVYIDSTSDGSTLTPVVSATAPLNDGYNGNDKAIGSFKNVTSTASTIVTASVGNWLNDKIKPVNEIYWANITINSSASVTSEVSKNYEWIGPKCTRTGQGQGSCAYYNNFFIGTPHCWTSAPNTHMANIIASTSSNFTFEYSDTTIASLADGSFDVYCIGRRK